MSDLIISAVPATMIDLVWEQCKPLLQPVIDRSHGEITEPSVYASLKRAETLLVIISEGQTIVAMNVIEKRELESGLTFAMISITGGTRLDEWMERFLEVAKAIAKDLGCTELRGAAVRKGWMRKLAKEGWEEVHTVIRCDLGE